MTARHRDTLSTVDARSRFSEVLNRAAFGKERVILTRRGKALAALVPLDDVDLLEELEDLLDVEDARAALEKWGRSRKRPVMLDELLDEFGIKR